MAQQIQAIYENGVLRPLEPLTLTEHQRVQISINGMVSEQDDTVVRPRAATVDLDASFHSFLWRVGTIRP